MVNETVHGHYVYGLRFRLSLVNACAHLYHVTSVYSFVLLLFMYDLYWKVQLLGHLSMLKILNMLNRSNENLQRNCLQDSGHGPNYAHRLRALDLRTFELRRLHIDQLVLQNCYWRCKRKISTIFLLIDTTLNTRGHAFNLWFISSTVIVIQCKKRLFHWT